MTTSTPDNISSLSTRTITVIGASRGTGATTAAMAGALGASVRAVSRSGGSPAPGVTTYLGDATDPEAVRAAISGTDAVLLMVGARGRDRSGIRASTTRAVIDVMHHEGVRRLIVQSSLGLGDSAHRLDFFTKYLVFPLVLGPAMADHAAQESITTASGLDWTIVRPGYLNDGPATGQVVALPSTSREPMRPRLSRADLAAWSLGAIDDAATVNHSVVLGSLQ
ncbi:MAG: NAD(P)-dependent oxidoreductase [Arachnia sp.]